MSKPLLIFMLLLLIPVAHKLYITLDTVKKLQEMPINHLAIIMDGNRRWAQQHQLAHQAGHRKGTQKLKMLIKYSIEKGIQIVSVYAFSLENFQRSPEEIQQLFTLMVEESEKALPEFKQAGVRIHFIGERCVFPETLSATIAKLETETAEIRTLDLYILFCYGGRQEILSAVNQIIKDVKEGKISSIDEPTFKNYLWASKDIPDPDLIIRTGGIKRLSNFLTFQTAYSELYFIDRFWPDLSTKDLDRALQDYQQRKRTFGK